MQNNPNLLELEALEKRQLLAVAVGVELNGDGDTYAIKLSGPGEILVTPNDLDLITVTGTTSKSELKISVTGQNIDHNGQVSSNGKVDVGTISVSSMEIGKISIDGSLRNITANTIKSLKVDSFSGNIDTPGTINLETVKYLKASSRVTYTNFTFRDKVGTIKLGNHKQEDGTVTNTNFIFHGDVAEFIIDNHLGSSQITQLGGIAREYEINGNVADSTIHIYDEAKTVKINGAVSRSDFDFDMSLKKLSVKKTWTDSTLDVKGVLTKSSFKSLISTDPIEVATQFTITSTGRITVKNDIIQARIGIDSDIERLEAGYVNGLALRINGNLDRLSTEDSLENSTISVLNNINKIKIGKNLHQSVIVSGINIGEDYLLNTADDQLSFENVLIKKISVGKNLIDSSIAVGILPNSNFFGDAFDTRFIDGHGNEVRANQEIRRIKVHGSILSTGVSGESYALVAEDGIDKITSKGKIYIDDPDGVRVPMW